MEYDIKDINLKEKGLYRIRWAEQQMPVLNTIRKRFLEEKPLKGINIGACLHVTTETANLVITLKTAGAKVFLCASNPLSTQDDVAAALVSHYKIPVFAIKGEDKNTYYRHIKKVLESSPDITMDDGADLVSTIHSEYPDMCKKVFGGTEETTTGVIRLKSMAQKGILQYPIIAVNDAMTKHLFDNRYGTGQSTIDGIIRATNLLLAGKTVVVAGYGWCGKGVAIRARGMGARVIITEINPIRALEAVMDGFDVMPMIEAAEKGDIFITLTGNCSVIRKEHFEKMKDGAIVANSGHFNVELNLKDLEKIAMRKKKGPRPMIDEFIFPDGKKIFLLGEGRLINLAAAEGHPASVMDMSFSLQALSVEYIYKNYKTLKANVYQVPLWIDKWVAELKLKSMGINIDTLTEEQKNYLESWEFGT